MVRQFAKSDFSPLRGLATVGVIGEGGAGYVDQMLAHLETGIVSVPLRAEDDVERIERASVTRIVRPVQKFGWLKRRFVSAPGAEPAMVSFSSGTEGPPKMVLLSRGNLHSAVERLTEAQGITGEIREYVAVPVHHSFGFGRGRAVLNAGGSLWLPENGFDLSEFRQMLADGQINALSAVPSQLRVLLQNLDLFGGALASVRWVEIGSQYMSADEKLRLRAALPNARIVQHYGLTEASRATLLRIDEEPAELLEAVGRVEGSSEVRISPKGRIEVRGPHVAPLIDEGTRLRQLAPDDWLETSDLGRIEDGALYFLGRDDDVINSSGIKLSPDMAESHVAGRLRVTGDFGVLRAPDRLRGDGIVVALTPEAAPQQADILEAVRSYARSLGTDPAGSLRAVVVDSLPRTATGKLQRRVLADRINQLPAHPPADPHAAQDAQGLGDLLDEVFGPGHSTSGLSFLELDADSLSHLQLSLALERALGTAPAGWESLPLAELVARSEGVSDPATRVTYGAPPLPKGDRNMNPQGISFWDLVREDFRANGSSLSHQGFLMLFVHRFGNWRMGVRPKLLRAPLTIVYRVLNKLTQILFGMKLDYTVQVGRRVRLEHFGGMILGAREIGDDVVLRQNTTLGIRSTSDLKAKPTIGRNVDVGAGAVIVGDITIGDNSVIGANSVVYTSVPPGSLVVGVPGRVVGRNSRSDPRLSSITGAPQGAMIPGE